MNINLSRRRLLYFWLALIPVFFVCWYFPYLDTPIRLAAWGSAFLFLVGILVLVWKFKVARYLLILVYVALAVIPFLPAHTSCTPADLKAAYCRALESYEGVHYFWGGENCTGMDCSGLVRKSMEDALFNEAVATRDPALLRAAISLYWHRKNARAIGEGYAGRTFPVTSCRTLNTLDYSLLQPGDLAVTAGGDHVMAYLGNKVWIAADPVVGKVAKFTIPKKRDIYFFTRMNIVRWRMLDETRSKAL